jgi:hypothetical protein
MMMMIIIIIMECKRKSDTSNNTGNWNKLKIIQMVPESRKTRNHRKQPTWALHTYCGKN